MPKSRSKAPESAITLELYKQDVDNLRVIQLNASSRHKAPTIRSVLRGYRSLVETYREVTKRGGKLKLVEEGMDGSQQVLIDRMDLEV
jgi:hypothetical protein